MRHLAGLVVEFADQAFAAALEAALGLATGAVAVLHVARVGLRRNEAVSAQDADGVASEAQQHDAEDILGVENFSQW